MWFKKSKKTVDRIAKENARRDRITESQLALLKATADTADAAQFVTDGLRKRLEDSQRQFESTARLISDALIVCDDQGSITAFNPAAETMFATTFEEIANTSILSLFLMDKKKITTTETLWKAIETGKDEVWDGADTVLMARKANAVAKERFHVDASLSRLVRQDGSTVVLILVRDLTDIIADERLNEENAKRFHTLFDLSFDGILIIQDATIVAANNSAAKLFGFEPDDLVNMTSNALFLTKPCSLTCLNVGGHCTVNACKDYATPHAVGKRQDGTPIQLLFSSSEITWNEKPAHLITFKDISDMRQITRAVQNVDNGKDMICVFGADFIIRFSNSYFNDYYGGVDNIGKDVRDLLPTSDRDTFMLKVRSLTPTNHTVRNQVQHLMNGKSRILDWVDHAVFDETGTITEYQRTGRDITDMMTKLLDN